MRKKVLLGIGILVLLGVVSFNGYKLVVYRHYTLYLNQTYPGRSFHVGWAEYDFLNRNCFSQAVCEDDGTTFTISGTNAIREQYLLTRNRKPIDGIMDSALAGEDCYRYIRQISASAVDDEALDTDGEIDYGKLAYDVYVVCQYNAIGDDRQFAELSYHVIRSLKSHGVQISSIAFDCEREKSVYSLLLEGLEVDGQVGEIEEHIEKRK